MGSGLEGGREGERRVARVVGKGARGRKAVGGVLRKGWWGR